MLAGSKTDAAAEAVILLRAKQWLQTTSTPPTPDTLRQLSAREGIDFATAVLYQHIAGSPEHGSLLARIDALRRQPIQSGRKFGAALVIVPGAFYIERPDTGGDGRWLMDLATALGCPCKRIPLLSVGTPAQNAEIILRWLAQQLDEKIILVSLSKGGADVKMALQTPAAAQTFRKVVAWVNVSGTLNGSPSADWVLAGTLQKWVFQYLYWWRGRNFEFMRDLRHQPGGPLDFKLCLPPTMKLLSILGFPLRRHLSHRYARWCHRAIAPLGPNDSTVLLADALAWPGLIYPVWGADHYLQPESDTRSLVAAVLQYLGEELELFDSSSLLEQSASKRHPDGRFMGPAHQGAAG
jgi:hypothetical protein